MTRFGLALDQMMRLTADEEAHLIAFAARSGYDSAWTPAPAALERDAFQVCLRWFDAAARTRALAVGIAVVPLPFWTVPALAVSAATLASYTGGKFVLGVGPSAVHIPSFRARYGVARMSPVTLVREYVDALRAMFRGELVTRRGEVVHLEGASLGFSCPPIPIYISALGPRMLELAGQVADGACLNWCTTDQIAASRAEIDAAARRAERGAVPVKLVQSIRVSIDDDVDLARRRLARAMLHYALAREGSSTTVGYRGHFGRMGFDDDLSRLERMRDAGRSDDEIADAFPVEIMQKVAYFGPAGEAASAVRRLSQGLDLALVRPVVPPAAAARVASVLEACSALVARP